MEHEHTGEGFISEYWELVTSLPHWGLEITDSILTLAIGYAWARWQVRRRDRQHGHTNE